MIMLSYAQVALELWGCIFCFIAALGLSWNRDKKRWKQQSLFIILLLMNSLMLAADSAAGLSEGNGTVYGYWIVRISSFCHYVLSYLLIYTFTKYVDERIRLKGGATVDWNLRVLRVVGIVFLTVLVLSQYYPLCYYFDAQNLYHRGELFWLPAACGLVGFALNVYSVVQNRHVLKRYDLTAFGICLGLPFAALLLQFLIYGISFLNIAITGVLMLLYLQNMLEQALEIYSQERKIAEQQKQLTDMRIQLMVSQIQPHFMYNCLNAIYYLCDEDPKRAQEAITRFSDYMRGNLDSLRQNDLIPFEAELKHIQNYLALEKMRFEDELEIVYDIGTTDFKVPALAVQPLVENAVRYGVSKKIDGGTVTIRTRALPEGTEIIVDDDGVGFDKNVKKNDGRSHTGMESVGNRLQAMCSGELDIQSTPGQGTHARIWLPKNPEKTQQLPPEKEQNYADMTWERVKSSLS